MKKLYKQIIFGMVTVWLLTTMLSGIMGLLLNKPPLLTTIFIYSIIIGALFGFSILIGCVIMILYLTIVGD